jgi:hypothetical protein
MNIIYVGFPGLGFQVKNLCVMFVFAIVSFLFFSEYQFAVDIVQGYNLQGVRERFFLKDLRSWGKAQEG